jgi:uridine monophosphate synthetase
MPTVAAHPAAPAAEVARQSLLTKLYQLGAIRFGQFTLASGLPSPLYIDLRLLVSDPSLLRQAAAAYAAALAGVPYDRLAGVPYAALPIGAALSLHVGKPLLYPRKEVKAYGLGKAIEGAWQPGERVVVVEDLVTSGGSTLKTVELLRAAGLVVEDVVVLIDREQGGRANLAAAGLKLHAVFTLGQVLDNLHHAGLLDAATVAEVQAYLAHQAPE